MSSRKFALHHHVIVIPNAMWIPFECYNPTMFGHLPTVYLQRSIAVAQVGYLLYPESFWWDTFLILDLRLHILNGVVWFDIQSDGFTMPSHSEWYHLVRHPM
eukprot:1017161_1